MLSASLSVINLPIIDYQNLLFNYLKSVIYAKSYIKRHIQAFFVDKILLQSIQNEEFYVKPCCYKFNKFFPEKAIMNQFE